MNKPMNSDKTKLCDASLCFAGYWVRWAANNDEKVSTVMTERKHYYFLYGLVFLGLISLIIVLEAVDSDLRKTLIEEDGPIELLSAVGYFICLIMVFLLKVKDFKSRWCIMFVLLVFGLRELDFHVLFTTMGMGKIKFYLSPDVPILEKIIGAAIIFALLYSFFYLVKRYFSDYMSAIKRIEPYAIGVFFGFLFIGISKALDGFRRRLADIEFAITNDVAELTTVIEEILELGIPVMFMIAIMAHFYRSSLTRA